MAIDIKIDSVRLFFDSDELIARLGKAKHDRLAKIGRYVQRAAQTSMRPAAIANKKEIRKARKAGEKEPRTRYVPSRPGESPRTRQDRFLRKFLFYGLEEADNVVIGPTGINGGAAGPAPHILEFGGDRTVVPRHDASGKFIDRRQRKARVVHVEARPYMRPAFDREKAKAPAMFADSL